MALSVSKSAVYTPSASSAYTSCYVSAMLSVAGILVPATGFCSLFLSEHPQDRLHASINILTITFLFFLIYLSYLSCHFLLIDCICCMSYIYLLNTFDSAKSINLCCNTFKISGCFKHAKPGILVFTCHIIIGMISGYYH